MILCFLFYLLLLLLYYPKSLKQYKSIIGWFQAKKYLLFLYKYTVWKHTQNVIVKPSSPSPSLSCSFLSCLLCIIFILILHLINIIWILFYVHHVAKKDLLGFCCKLLVYEYETKFKVKKVSKEMNLLHHTIHCVRLGR